MRTRAKQKNYLMRYVRWEIDTSGEIFRSPFDSLLNAFRERMIPRSVPNSRNQLTISKSIRHIDKRNLTFVSIKHAFVGSNRWISVTTSLCYSILYYCSRLMWRHIWLSSFWHPTPTLMALIASPILMYPRPSRQHAGLQHEVWQLQQEVTSGQSYKGCTIINYDSRVVPDLKIPHITTLGS